MRLFIKKGLLIKEKNVMPTYNWYNGTHRRYLKGDPVNLTGGITCLNPPAGDVHDSKAKITPYKMIQGVEPADAEFGYLIIPKLFGDDGYFKSLNWQDAAENGMKAADLEFSGKITFVRTQMHWRLNHGVVPAKSALACLDCHHPEGVMDFKALGYAGDPAPVGGRHQKDKVNNQDNDSVNALRIIW